MAVGRRCFETLQHPLIYDRSQGPVAKGALLVEHLLDQSQLRAMYSIGLLFEIEGLDEEKHPDALDAQGQHRKGIVKVDDWYSRRGKPAYVVEDRITWLLAQVSLRIFGRVVMLTAAQDSHADVHGRFQSRTTRQQFHVPLNDPKIGITTVFTTKTDVQDHEPLRSADGSILHGMEPETYTIHLTDGLVERFKSNGWIVALSPGWCGKKRLPKEPHIELWCQLMIRHDNKTIDIGIDIISPESIPYRREYHHSMCSDRPINMFQPEANFNQRLLGTISAAPNGYRSSTQTSMSMLSILRHRTLTRHQLCATTATRTSLYRVGKASSSLDILNLRALPMVDATEHTELRPGITRMNAGSVQSTMSAKKRKRKRKIESSRPTSKRRAV